MGRLIIILLSLCCLQTGANASSLEDLVSLTIGMQAPSPDLPPAPAPSRTGRRVCVDPGHPNTFNSATHQVNGTNENHINWVVGLKLEKLLKERGFDVVMTKNDELQSVENKARARFCNASGAELVLHLHCDSAPTRGFALYYPDQLGTHDYKDDAENGFRGPSAPVRAGSKTLADAVALGMRQVLSGVLRDRGVFGDSRTAVGGRQGALTYSIFSEIPTLTIEMVVLSDKADAAFIKTEQGQQKMAEAIAAGVALY